MTTAAPDAMTAAMNATNEPQERTYFGEIITVDAWFCVLQKGTGKRPWDPSHDAISERRTVIKLEIQPLRGEYQITQEVLHFEPAWLKHTMPSLQKLGADLHALHGQFCQVKRVLTGEQYKNKAGELKDKTALEFAELYTDRSSCSAAADAFFTSRKTSNGTSGPLPQEDLPGDLGMSPEQQFALNALPALWKASGQDKAKFTETLQQNPLISKYYPVTHPHVQALTGETDLF